MEKSEATFDKLPSVVELKKHYEQETQKVHLKDMLNDDERNQQLLSKLGDEIILDLTHTRIDKKGLELLKKVGQEAKVQEKIKEMFAGKIINTTEKRSVLHVALRMDESQSLVLEKEGDVVKNVHEILNRMKGFSEQIRSGQVKGYSGKPLTTVVVIGIGGSYLGPEFVFEALRHDSNCNNDAKGRKLKFLANVDPVDFQRVVADIDIEETLVVINSKTFTTAETMLNAKTVRQFIIDHYQKTHQQEKDPMNFVRAHMCAVSTNLTETKKFGVSDERVFGFWDWVGGRFSVCAAVGVLPLSLHYGFNNMKQFLQGAKAMDDVFLNQTTMETNIPLSLGLVGFYNTYICGLQDRAILPYSQALLKFPAHIQQLDMESNGKKVCKSQNTLLPEEASCGPVIFGEPGTNGQHSFYQLMHQGRTIAGEFIGFAKSQQNTFLQGEKCSSHEELMSNFFAQPDALALGKTIEQLEKEGCPKELQNHKLFLGNKPSLSILFLKNSLTPFVCGQLLSMYENRVAVEGFIYDINSFDQWGVELGKVLAKDIRSVFETKAKKEEPNLEKFNKATQHLLKAYLSFM